MPLSRRHILAIASTSLVSRLLAGTLRPAKFNVDRLLDAAAGGSAEVYSRKYVATAAITLFSLQVASKSGVGTGYTVIEEAPGNNGKTVAIQFGAGSVPACARGLNRLGYIQEVIVEEQDTAVECAYLAFMTTSKEKNLQQAKQALSTSGENVAYSAAQGFGRNDRFSSRVDRLQFPARFTWRNISELIGQAREAMDGLGTGPQEADTHGDRLSTFLYAVRRALLDPSVHTTSRIFFNSKRFELQTSKVKDEQAGLIRLNALLVEQRTGEKTQFRLWYEPGAEKYPPVRFDYQARSFLRLSFEANGEAAVPPIHYVLNHRENA